MEEMPIGLTMAFAENLKAFEHFSSLDHAQRQQIIEGARQVRSRQEMREYVNKVQLY